MVLVIVIVVAVAVLVVGFYLESTPVKFAPPPPVRPVEARQGSLKRSAVPCRRPCWVSGV